MTPVDATCGVAGRPREVTLALFRLLDGTPRADWLHWLAAREQVMVRSDLCPCCTGQVATRSAVAAALRRAPERHTVWVELGAADHPVAAARALAAGLTGARVATRFVLVAGEGTRVPGDAAVVPGTTMVHPASDDGAPDWELLELARAGRPPAGAGRPVDP